MTDEDNVYNNVTAKGQDDGSIDVTYTPSSPSKNNRTVEVVISGMKSTNVSFAVGEGVEAYSVSANTEGYVFGTPLEVTVSLNNADYGKGKAYNLSFVNANETLKAVSPVIPSTAIPASFTVEVVPMINGAYVMQAPQVVTTVID